MSLDKTLSNWLANSANAKEHPEITLWNAQIFPQLLFQLEREVTPKNRQQVIKTSQHFESEYSDPLSDIFLKMGSDKSRWHDYQHCYGHVVKALGRKASIRLLEIGIGTNNTQLVSNMGASGKPGASLRAWRDIFVNGAIYGADIDKDILFKETRIETEFVDQMDQSSFKTLYERCGNQKFDVIIDDGLHCISANMNSLLFALKAINNNGWIVIEDIRATALAPLFAINRVLETNPTLTTHIVKTRRCYMYLVHKKAL